MFVLPAVHAVCDASSMAIHNRVSVLPYRASRSFPYLIHPGPALPALAAGRRPAVLHRDLFGFLHLSALSALQAISRHRYLLQFAVLLVYLLNGRGVGFYPVSRSECRCRPR